MWVVPTSGCHLVDVLGEPQRSGQSETFRRAELVDIKKKGLQVRKVRHEGSAYEREPPADMVTKPLPGPKIEQVMKILGYEFVGQHLERKGVHWTRLVSSQQRAE